MTLTELQSSQQSVAVERQRQAALSSQLAEIMLEKDEVEHALIQTRDKLQVSLSTDSVCTCRSAFEILSTPAGQGP